MPLGADNPNLSPQFRQLQNSVQGVQSSMRRFNNLLYGIPQRTSSSRMIRTSRGQGEERNLFEQLAAPLLRKGFNSLFQELTGGNSGRSSRSSEGQLMAELASSIARASQRNL